MPAPRKYSNELRERALPGQRGDGGGSGAVAERGGAPDRSEGQRRARHPARGWTNQARVDAGLSPGTTTAESAKVKELERKVKELPRKERRGGEQDLVGRSSSVRHEAPS